MSRTSGAECDTARTTALVSSRLPSSTTRISADRPQARKYETASPSMRSMRRASSYAGTMTETAVDWVTCRLAVRNCRALHRSMEAPIRPSLGGALWRAGHSERAAQGRLFHPGMNVGRGVPAFPWVAEADQLDAVALRFHQGRVPPKSRDRRRMASALHHVDLQQDTGPCLQRGKVPDQVAKRVRDQPASIHLGAIHDMAVPPDDQVETRIDQIVRRPPLVVRRLRMPLLPPVHQGHQQVHPQIPGQGDVTPEQVDPGSAVLRLPVSKPKLKGRRLSRRPGKSSVLTRIAVGRKRVRHETDPHATNLAHDHRRLLQLG